MATPTRQSFGTVAQDRIGHATDGFLNLALRRARG